MSEKNTNDKKTGEMKKKRYNPEQKCEDLIRKLREQCGSHNISYYALAKEADVSTSACPDGRKDQTVYVYSI